MVRIAYGRAKAGTTKRSTRSWGCRNTIFIFLFSPLDDLDAVLLQIECSKWEVGRVKKTYLIAPFVDDRHVDVINEAGHLTTSWRTIRGTHTFIYIALNCALWREHV